jgi:branched-subunit amino acid permease
MIYENNINKTVYELKPSLNPNLAYIDVNVYLKMLFLQIYSGTNLELHTFDTTFEEVQSFKAGFFEGYITMI